MEQAEKQILLNVIQEQAMANANQLIQLKALESKVLELENEQAEKNTEEKGEM